MEITVHKLQAGLTIGYTQETEDFFNAEEQINYKHSIGCYHSSYKLELSICPPRHKFPIKRALILSGLITGCGLMQLKGIAYLSELEKEDFKKLDKEIIKAAKESKVYAIIATLGDPFKKAKIYIQDYLGFKELSTYRNPMHESTLVDRYYQTLYIKNIE